MKPDFRRLKRRYVGGAVAIAVAAGAIATPLAVLDGRTDESAASMAAPSADGDPQRREQPEGLRPSVKPWATDFTMHSAPLEDFAAAGPQKDGIPAINDPKFTTAEEASSWIKPSEPVIELEVGD